jgi:hypothetical protein
MSNPTSKAFDYTGYLYMGTNLAVMSQVDFHLEAAEEKNISFPVTMPSEVGTYPVYIGVFSGGVNIALYKAVEDVTIVSFVGWVLPTGFIDPTGLWYRPENAYDDDINTFASVLGTNYRIPIELTLASPINCNKVRVNADSGGAEPFTVASANIIVDVYYEGAYHNIFSGLAGPYYQGWPWRKLWVEIPIPAGIKLVNKARIRWNHDQPVYLWEFDFYKAT